MKMILSSEELFLTQLQWAESCSQVLALLWFFVCFLFCFVSVSCFSSRAEHLQLSGNFCNGFSFQSYGDRFSKVFLFWSFWKSLSLTCLHKVVCPFLAPRFGTVILLTWYTVYTFPPRQILIYIKSELCELCWLQVNTFWLVLKSCNAQSWK